MRHARYSLMMMIFAVLLWTAAIVVADDSANHRSSIADAAEHQNLQSVKRLLAQKHDPNAKQADGMTALLWAVYHEQEAMAEQLIAAGADVSATNRYGVGALSLACANGNSRLVQLLLEHGADANATLRGGETVLMTAARTGRLPIVKALLAKGAKIDAREKQGQSALMWAAAEGHADVVDTLIQSGADFKTPLKSGFTPLCFAARNGRIAVTQQLIKAGVDVNQAMSQATGGRNKPVRHTSPLLLAMENGHFELAVILLEAGADPNDARTGFAPLHAMSWIRKPEIGDNESGTPPPRGSGKLTSLEFVRALVKHGARIDERKASNGGGRRKISVKGITPFLCAASTADVALMKTLLELGAVPKLRDSRGRTALMMAAGMDEGPEGDGPGTKDEHLAAVTFLLKHGADANAVDHSGETAMHGAAYKSLPRVVHLLADHGADIKIWARKSKHGRTPLSIAQGFRPGNFKPSFETVAAIKKVMIARGVTPPPPPKRKDGPWQD